MKTMLTDQERAGLDRRVAEAEKRTGAQIVVAVVGRSDAYAELPWKAFALGAAAAGLIAVLSGQLKPGWDAGPAVLHAVAAMLAAGASCALLCVFFPGFGRVLLDGRRAEAEAKQYAQSLFLAREVFATRGRTGVLLLVSMFERKVVLLPDAGLAKRLSGESLQQIVDRVTAVLVFAGGRPGRALEEGLQALEESLGTSTGAAENELPNLVVEEKGS